MIRSIVVVLGVVFALPVTAAPLERAIVLARAGRCDAAIPLLLEAENVRHRPRSAAALADCYDKGGRLIEANAIYRGLAGEKRSYAWDYYDVVAWQRAPKRAAELAARIPTIAVSLRASYPDVSIAIDGKPAPVDKPIPVPPDKPVRLEVRAPRHQPFETELAPAEGEKRVVDVTLQIIREAPTPKPRPRPRPAARVAPLPPREPPALWLGARFRGTLIPEIFMHAFGEGGTTVFAPGGGITLSAATAGPDVVASIGYASFAMGPTLYKPRGRPDTEYEILESDLMSLFATVDLLAPVPLSADGAWLVRIGGGIGIGWMFFGELYRTQAYPGPDGYQKCTGPNDPPGTFRYCNQLDKDADHYAGFGEPDWFHGGVRPLIYPWVSLPQIELSWAFVERGRLDLEVGLTVAGILMGLGVRYGL